MAFAKGVEIFSSCKKKESIPEFNKHLKANPNDYYARYYRGRAFEITGDIEKALDDFRFLMTHNEGAKRSVAEAKLIMLQKSPRAAADSLIKATEQYPESGLVYSVLGRILVVDLEEYNEAFPYLWEAVRIEHPLIGSAFYDLATVFSVKQDYKQAEKYFRNALLQHETMTIAHLDLGEVLTCLGRLTEANEHLSRAAELNPDLYGQYYASKRLPPKLDDILKPENLKKIASYGGRQYYMPKEYEGKPNKNVWYVKDTASHAGCYYKVYLQRDGCLNFECGVDEFGRYIKKHESMAGTKIPMKELNFKKNS